MSRPWVMLPPGTGDPTGPGVRAGLVGPLLPPPQPAMAPAASPSAAVPPADNSALRLILFRFRRSQ